MPVLRPDDRQMAPSTVDSTGRQDGARARELIAGYGKRGGVPDARSMMRATISSAVVFSPGRLGLPAP